MSRLVDTALSKAPASSSNVHSSDAAPSVVADTASQALPGSASIAHLPVASCSNAEVQPVADAREERAGASSQPLGTSAVAESNGSKDAQSSEYLGSSASARSIGSKKAHKPAWAMTADAAQDAEQREEEDLLAFAGGLEFDKYINEQEDAKLRTALQVLALLLQNGYNSMLLKQIMSSCTELAVVVTDIPALLMSLSAGKAAAIVQLVMFVKSTSLPNVLLYTHATCLSSCSQA